MLKKFLKKLTKNTPQPLTLNIRMPNWLGDAMMCLPALQYLEKAGVKFSLYGKAWLRDLLSATSWQINSLESKVLGAAKQYRNSPNQHLLLFTNSFSSALAGKLGGQKTIGFNTDARRVCLNVPIKKPPYCHEVEYYWLLAHKTLQFFQVDHSLKKIPAAFSLALTASQKATADNILKKAGVCQPYWVLCPNSTGKHRGRDKCWPYWREFCRALISNNITVVACPGPGEEVITQHLLPDAMILKNIDLKTYAAILAQAQKVIANDTGPMHLANAVNRNVLGVFGVTNPMQTRPWGGRVIGNEKQWPDVNEVLAALEN